ncbi:RAN GTPase-activating protein 2 [Ancistrocladus abbreviatus]
MDGIQPNSEKHSFSIKLWPPSRKTRLVLVDRMTDNMSAPTIFTRKYGRLDKEEAVETAKQIEEKVFSTANQHYEKQPDGDGSSAVQIYAKECSRLILEVLKRGLGTTEVREVPTSEKAHEGCFDISKGPRAFIEFEEAVELLQPLKAPGNSYTKICFSNRSFGLGAAHVAEPILASLKSQLKEVDLSDFIAVRPEAEALEVMNIFSAALEGCSLKSLNLSNNALGEKGIRAFGALLKSQDHLEELYLMNDGISEEAARAVCELAPPTEKLRVLQFHNNMTGDEGALAISEVVKQSPLLEDFRCSSTRVGSEGGAALSEALEACEHLKKLDLRDNMFGVEAGVALSKALLKHAKLTEVYLSYLNLEDEGAVAIANALKDSAPSLEVLEMAGNDITSVASPALAACLATKQLLNKLNLAENELKDDGAIQIAKSLDEGHAQLRELDMNTNSMGWVGAKVLARVVVRKPVFKMLNINGNFISNDGVDEVKDVFKKSPRMLGSLNENDPEGGDDDDYEKEAEGDDDEAGELGAKLKNLNVGEDYRHTLGVVGRV